ncbi:primosomal replication protein N [Xylophilus sp. GOD-11R]|uniref:primosomal replication protein N n=1 Tax=Xylophilus sp. GOD-11R TaxID=3089814 RepID=UPI00298D0769|nr:primosomal replication protein N [Xylophilus sp. GOD-11R]WPB55115.1 primosomal replication protein N [Xylophilus sp. GOD-11R]
MENHLVISAFISEAKPMRYTPAGLPALDMRIEHVSRMTESGQERDVKVDIKAVAIGSVAERLAGQEIGSQWRFTGFLASPRSARTVVFHVQDFQQV